MTQAIEATLKRLQTSEQHLHRLLVSARDAVVAMDDQGLITEWNPAAQDLFGWSNEEALGQPLSELIVPPEHREAHNRGFRSQLRQSGPEPLHRRMELQALHRNGELLDVEVSLWSFASAGGTGFGAFIRDIRERLTAQAALRQSEDRYRQVVEHLGEGMGIIENGLTVYANQKAVEILRRPLDMILGHSFVDWIHPDDREQIADRQRRRQRGEAVPDRYELRCLHLDGSVRWLETHASMLPWEGRPATMTFFSDVTERRAMHEAIEQSEQRYRTVIEHLGEGMMVVQNGLIVFANPRVQQILGRPLEQILGTRSTDVLHPDDRAAVQARQQQRDAGVPVSSHVELRLHMTDGDIRWLDTHSTTIQWEGRTATMSFFSDITERKRMIEALRQSEERYRIVIEHVGEAMVVVQGEKFVFVNRKACEICQMSAEDMLRHGFLHRIHPDDHGLVQDRRRRRLAGEDVPNRYEIRLLLPDATVRWIDIGVTVVPWEGSTGTLTFFSDVTARKVLENRLQQTLQERETILENSLVGIAFLTPQGRFRWANRAMFQIFGSTEARPLQSMEMVYPSRDEYLRVGGEVSQAILQGRDFQSELEMRRLDGPLIWVSLSGRAVSHTDLSQGTVWSVMDISQRKALEDKLQRTSSEREAIMDSALVGIGYAVNRRLEWVNHKFAEMLGYTREALIGQSTQMHYVSEEQWRQLGEASRQGLLTQGYYTDERQLKRRNGELLWVQMAGRCVQDRNPDSGVIWTLLDITQRRRAEEDTQAALQRQKELNELRTRFVAMTSHEFRTPLATILSSAELLRYYSDRLGPEERADVLQNIENGVQRMTRMLDRVLLLGKAEAQMLEFKPQPMDLLTLCKNLAEDVRQQQPKSLCVLRTEFADDLGICMVDEKLLHHIFSNLLSNAIKYSPLGGTVVFRAWRHGTALMFEVSDQGIGIPTDEIPHLFESFHRASNVGDIQGTGLGLAIVKSSVDLHGGDITVHSQPGIGTTFTVRIDAIEAPCTQRHEHG